MFELDEEGRGNDVLRLLLVEDSDEDAGLIARRLSDAGLRFGLRRVRTGEELRAALRDPFDLIISSLAQAEGGAAAVFDTLAARQRPIPVIIVSGPVADEAVVRAMKRGAADYLVKDRLARLPQAVMQAVEVARMRTCLERQHRRLEAALARAAHLSKQLARTQEDERKVLARELHDELGQRLTSLNLVLYRLQPCLQDAKAAQLWCDAARELSELFDQVREMSAALRPPVLDHFGLEAAVRHLGDRLLGRAGIDFSLEFAGVPEAPGSLIEITAYRVVQESLNNVIRHAGASRVVVEINAGADGEEMEIVVRDDGKGFDASVWPPQRAGVAGSGLCGMRERIELLGGRFALQSAPGGGTRVAVLLPLGNRKDESD